VNDTFLHSSVVNYYYYIRLTAFFQDNLGKSVSESNPFWILLEQQMMG